MKFVDKIKSHARDVADRYLYSRLNREIALSNYAIEWARINTELLKQEAQRKNLNSNEPEKIFDALGAQGYKLFLDQPNGSETLHYLLVTSDSWLNRRDGVPAEYHAALRNVLRQLPESLSKVEYEKLPMPIHYEMQHPYSDLETALVCAIRHFMEDAYRSRIHHKPALLRR